jgi:hypothetical protein
MNAFKKELAGMLLDDHDSDRAMEQVVNNMDDVFKNMTLQKDYTDSYSMWYTFLNQLTMHFVYMIQRQCYDDDVEASEDVKTMMKVFILLESAGETQYEEMLYDDINDSYRKTYDEIKESILK